jgi:hypothetical protein
LNGLAERGLQPCRLDALLGIDAYAPAHGAAT